MHHDMWQEIARCKMNIRGSRCLANFIVIVALVSILALYAHHCHHSSKIFISQCNHSTSETPEATGDTELEIILNISTDPSQTEPYWAVGTALQYYPLPILNMKTFMKGRL